MLGVGDGGGVDVGGGVSAGDGVAVVVLLLVNRWRIQCCSAYGTTVERALYTL